MVNDKKIRLKIKPRVVMPEPELPSSEKTP